MHHGIEAKKTFDPFKFSNIISIYLKKSKKNQPIKIDTTNLNGGPIGGILQYIKSNAESHTPVQRWILHCMALHCIRVVLEFHLKSILPRAALENVFSGAFHSVNKINTHEIDLLLFTLLFYTWMFV